MNIVTLNTPITYGYTQGEHNTTNLNEIIHYEFLLYLMFMKTHHKYTIPQNYIIYPRLILIIVNPR